MLKSDLHTRPVEFYISTRKMHSWNHRNSQIGGMKAAAAFFKAENEVDIWSL